MHALELKVPPPLVALVMGIAMWFLSRLSPSPEVLPIARMLAVVCLAAVGTAFSLSGVVAFRRAKTTVNPLKPESASSLVSAGVYKITRNPMYAGMLLLLLAWAAFLWSAWSLLGLLGFAAYISRFQIVPEERVLCALFGAEFAEYKARVRRWL
ncbi:MAG: isoprenylcysteine carboxylmethyltransferase family protein [Betaproteobacteria bacterium]